MTTEIDEGNQSVTHHALDFARHERRNESPSEIQRGSALHPIIAATSTGRPARRSSMVMRLSSDPARRLGAGRIVAMSRSSRRTDLCLEMGADAFVARSVEHTSELQYLMRRPSAVFCLR